jgi:hypothetical protein
VGKELEPRKPVAIEVTGDEGSFFVSDKDLVAAPLKDYFAFIKQAATLVATQRDYKFQVLMSHIREDGVKGALITWKKKQK